MADDPLIHIEVAAPTLDDLRAFMNESRAEPACRAVARKAVKGFVIEVFLPAGRLAASRAEPSAARVEIRLIENATEVGRRRQKEVGRGNRFAARGSVPRGLGEKA